VTAPRPLLLLRHGATAWNELGRIQGRHDEPLSPAGRAGLAGCRVPAPWRDGEWVTSPLRRAAQTAALLGAPRVSCAAALTEMDWGEWEGCTLGELRRRDSEGMRRNEARGLDFRPPAGESPRDVCARLAAWVRELDAAGPALVAVTHKGVIRAALSLATGWDLSEDYPQRLRWERGHAFARAADGGLALVALNVALEKGP
jgi:probable phosphoglycerate mutase